MLLRILRQIDFWMKNFRMKNFRMKKVFLLLAVFGLMLAAGCGSGGGSSVAGTQDPNIPPMMQQPERPPITPPLPPPPPDPFEIGTPDSFFMEDGAFETNNGGTSIVDMTEMSYESTEILGATIVGLPGSGLIIIDPPDNSPFDVGLPPAGVKEAWREGWTGEGVPVLIADCFELNPLNRLECPPAHGYSVLFSLLATAPHASVYVTDAFGPRAYGTRGVLGAFRADEPVGSLRSFDVVNVSFGLTELVADAARRDARVAEYQRTSLFFADLKGESFVLGGLAGDAVVTKSASNDDGADAGHLPDNVAFVIDPSIGPRVLIVGATRGYYDDDVGAEMATYSNVAGSNSAIRDRFVVANGDSPFAGRVRISGQPVNPVDINPINSVGTSFAAPRVAGYAAIVRQKFPNLTGANTATIMLDTATYEGLMCNIPPSSCAENIYGQGRVDIGAALAPSGQMR